MKKFAEFFRGEKTERDDLICFFYQTVKESETCEGYLKQAERMGDKALAEFFREVQAQDRLRAYRVEELIKQRLTS